MKTNTAILTITLTLLILTGMATGSLFRVKTLQTQFSKEALLSKQLNYSDIGLSLTGKALVLYNVSHLAYPSFTVRRIQIMNTSNTFNLSLKGIHGSLTKLFQQTEPYGFKHQILAFSPSEHLLKKPFISLAVLGYDLLDADVSFSATSSANQIICDLTFKDHGKVKAQFSAKLPLKKAQLSIWENLKDASIPFYMTYLDAELKEKLDNYALSKGLPFITQDPLYFSFSI